MEPSSQQARLGELDEVAHRPIPALAAELERRMHGYGVAVLADRLLPDHGYIDRIAIGSGGVTLIDVSSYCGSAAIRNGRLICDGADCTGAIDRLLAQRREVELMLEAEGDSALQVKAALSWPDVEGPARFGSLTLKGVRIDGARGVARLARRSGELPPEGVTLVAAALDRDLD